MFKSSVKVKKFIVKTTSKSVGFYIAGFIKVKKIKVSHLNLHTQITIFTHLKYLVLYLLNSWFYTQSTRPTITINYKII